MSQTIETSSFKELENIEFDTLHYSGNLDLLQQPKVAIVGTRRPNAYTKKYTYEIAYKLSQNGIVVVSGTAMGVDIIAHQGAGAQNTIAVVASGVDVRYPKVNSTIIDEIEQKGLILSPYPNGTMPRKYTFLQRNEIIAALCDVVVIAEADLKSGSLNTAKWAIEHQKKIFVLPHRLGESEGSQELVREKNAQMILDVDTFVASLFCDDDEKQEGGEYQPLLIPQNISQDEIMAFCQNHPFYEEAIEKFGDKIFEYELIGKIVVKDGIIHPR